MTAGPQPSSGEPPPAQGPPPRAAEEAPLEGQLHPAAVVLGPLRQLAPLAVVALTGQLAAGLPGGLTGFPIGLGFLGVAAAALLVGGFVRWLRFRWGVAGGALVIAEGLLERKRRVIPLDRIQAVDLARPLRHRLLGVVEVRVEAVGGKDTEGRIDALDPATAARLREVLLRRPAAPPLAGVEAADRGGAHTDAGRLLARVPPRRLVLAGITGARVGVAAALVGFAQQVLGERVEDVFDVVGQLDLTRAALLGIGLITLVFAISVVATALSFWGFELRRSEAVLTVRRGLLEQRFETVPLRRVQAVSVDENIVRRLFGLAAVKVVVAGRTGGDAGQQTAVLLPIGRRAEAFALAEEVLGVAGLAAAPLQPMPRASLHRRLRQALLGAAVVTAGLAVPFGPAGWFGLASLILLLPLAAASYRGLGHGEHAGHLLAREGALLRRTTFVPVAKLQSLGLRQSPFQRRLGLATLALHLPSSSSPSLTDLDAAHADALQHRLLSLAAG